MSAAGTFAPPFFIFPRQRVSALLGRYAPLGSVVEISKKGWTSDELFMKWLVHFKDHAKPTAEKPVLLVLDNHSSHISVQAIDFCLANNIHMVSLPPHCSHRIQPLDVTFYGPLKAAYNKHCDNFMKTNHLERITPYDVPGIFATAYNSILTPEKGINGFRCTGIWPLNPDIFKTDPTLLPSAPSTEDERQFPNDAVSLEDEEQMSTEEDDVQSSCSSPTHSFTDTVTVNSIPAGCTVEENVEIEELIPIIGDEDIAEEGDINAQLESLCPVPDMTPKPQANARQKQHSEIYTNPRMREILNDRKQKKEEKKKLAEETRRKKAQLKEDRMLNKLRKQEEIKLKKIKRAEEKERKAEEIRMRKEQKEQEKLMKMKQKSDQAVKKTAKVTKKTADAKANPLRED